MKDLYLAFVLQLFAGWNWAAMAVILWKYSRYGKFFMFAFVQKHQKGIVLKLHVAPGASKSELSGTHGDALKIRISARAESGAANRALCAFLAEIFDLPKMSVTILHGQSSRNKTVLIQGKSDELARALAKLCS